MKNDTEQIILAHPEILAKGEITICGLIMDRSGSMQRFGDTPRTAINEHISKLKAHPNADNALGFVMTFADDSRFDLEPQPLKDMPLLPEYRSDGNTWLYGTVLEALQAMLKLKAQAGERGVKANMIMAVFTDGEDNESSGSRAKLVKVSGQALEQGLELILVGIGMPAKEIAQDMGFPPQCAMQIAGTMHAVRQTMTHITSRTCDTMTGSCGFPSRPSTPTPSSSH